MNARIYGRFQRMFECCTDASLSLMRKSKRSAGGWSSCLLTCHGTQRTVSCGWLAVFLSWILATILTRDAPRTGTASGMRCTPYCPQRRMLHAVAVELYTNGRQCKHSVRTPAHWYNFISSLFQRQT